MRALWASAVAIFVLDQLSKYLILYTLELPAKQIIDVAPPYLRFLMAWNEGINFGLLSSLGDNARWVLIVVALAICCAVLWWMRRETKTTALVSAGVLIGGALGNVIDRVIYGAVADFLNMSCCGIANPFAFNVADIAIFVGAVGLIFFASDPDKNKA